MQQWFSNSLVIGLLTVGLESFAMGQVIFTQPLSPRIANYQISAVLNTEKKTVQGKQVLTWRNHTQDTISELRFHLYLNAFKNSETTFMCESGGINRSFSIGEKGWGWIDVSSIKVVDGEDLTDKIDFIQPDDGNRNDQTVIRVPLSTPVQPQQTIQLALEFMEQLPRAFARTGYQNNFFMVAQWFPKIGVYEAPGERYATRGSWNCHQFHSNTEFFADYGIYDVDLTVPSDYVVGAVGLLQKERANGDGTKTMFYRAEDVHDFCWTADPVYRVARDKWNNVEVTLLYQPSHSDQVTRYLNAAKIGLEYFDKLYGKYPYPNLTVVDPPVDAMGAGGMEYPTLITAGAFWNMPEGIKFTEMVTIHEFGHQYWYGLVANNEFEEAWLDEGINTYSEIKIMTAAYGEDASLIKFYGISISDLAEQRGGYTCSSDPKRGAIFQKAWTYERGGYGTYSYSKPGLMLVTLENYLGQETMAKIMRTFFERWKFRHPTSRDFIAVVNEVSGKDLNWYFDQVLYGTDVVDYAVSSISNREVGEKLFGVFERNGQKATLKGEKDTTQRHSNGNELFESKVIVSRLGEVKLPVEVFIKFVNGETLREQWDGQDRWKVFKYQKDTKVLSVEVDPDHKIPLDVNLTNNSKTTDRHTIGIWKYVLRWLFWMQSLLHYFSMFA
jgi:hypothetical protein